jgi:hypothetical protein
VECGVEGASCGWRIASVVDSVIPILSSVIARLSEGDNVEVNGMP